MKQSFHMPWILLQLFANIAGQIGVDSELPLASSWLEGDWSYEQVIPDQVFVDVFSGCLCRHKIYDHVVCYGGRRCKRFPSNMTLASGVNDFRIKTSVIEEILVNDLKSLKAVRGLQIDANNHLQRIAPGAFKILVHLKQLSISYNSELRHLDPRLFEGLINLESLRLIRNGFENILDASNALNTQYLPKLISLSLNENYFPVIDNTSFALLNGSQIVELEIILCQIEYIDPKALSVFQALRYLRLGDNLISEVVLRLVLDELIAESIPLNLLNLYNSGFRRDEKLTDLLDTIAQLNVSHLVLSRNHIEYISAGLFPYMPNLKILDLREVSAVTVEIDALSPDIVPNLEVLLLGGNKLSGITPGVLLPQLLVLDLTENSVGTNAPSYFDVTTSSSWSRMSNLRSLDISYNRVSTIVNSTFIELGQLRALGLKNGTIFFIAPNSFNMLSQLTVLNLEYNPFMPFNQFEFPIFEGLKSLETLYLGFCKIKSFSNPNIFNPLTSLKYLNLKGNELTTLDWQVLHPIGTLVGIDMSQNQLQPWTAPARFSNNPNLRIAILSSNRLSAITGTMMEDFINLTRLDISQNTFVCDCWAFNQTIDWFRKRNQYANDSCLLSPNHVCSSPKDWRDQLLVNFLDSTATVCSLTEGKAAVLTIYMLMGAVAFLSVTLGIFSYIYRWHIRYWIFLSRMAFLRRHGWLLKKNKVHASEYKYDVFVSYSHEDRSFIVRLVAMLENHEPYLKLCVYERDFEIGTVISDTVMEKVSASRRTLLIVSNAFAKSQWCMWELQLAEFHRLFFRSNLKEQFRNDPLVIIKLGPVAESNMTPTLKFLLKSRIYLEWNHDPKRQKVFWEKLKGTLTPPNRTILSSDKSIDL